MHRARSYNDVPPEWQLLSWLTYSGNLQGHRFSLRSFVHMETRVVQASVRELLQRGKRLEEMAPPEDRVVVIVKAPGVETVDPKTIAEIAQLEAEVSTNCCGG